MTISPETLRAHIIASFLHVYPGDTTLSVSLNDDETITVSSDVNPEWTCEIDSDDDEYLRFALRDADYEEEHPEEDPLDYVSIRILTAPRT